MARDYDLVVRGGVTIYADVFRPADRRPAPSLIAWSPYGKHAEPQLPERYPDGGVAPGQLSPASDQGAQTRNLVTAGAGDARYGLTSSWLPVARARRSWPPQRRG